MRLQEEARPIPTWVEALTDTFSSSPETHHTPPHSGEKHGTHHTTTLSKPTTPPPPLPPMHLLNSFSLSVFSLYPLHAPNSHGLGVARGRDPAITTLPPPVLSPAAPLLRQPSYGRATLGRALRGLPHFIRLHSLPPQSRWLLRALFVSSPGCWG